MLIVNLFLIIEKIKKWINNEASNSHNYIP